MAKIYTNNQWQEIPVRKYETSTDSYISLPQTFISDEDHLDGYDILGNGQQSGTPTPDNPIIPTFCGVRSAQLIDYTLSESGGIDASGNLVSALNLWRSNVFYDIHDGIALSFANYPTLLLIRVNYYDANYLHISREEFNTTKSSGASLTIPANAKYFKWTMYAESRTTINLDFVRQCYIMLNSGSTALPYEPFGYKIPISCAGQTTPVYLGQTQTVRRIKKLVLDGTENFAFASSDANRTVCSTVLKGVSGSYGYCSHIEWKASYASTEYNRIVWVSTSGGTLFVSIENQYLAEQTVDAFKAYLAHQYANGTPVTVWYVLATEETGIVNEPLCKIGDYADELHSEDAGVTIPTAKGNNVLTVDTDLQPSKVNITYKGWHKINTKKYNNDSWVDSN